MAVEDTHEERRLKIDILLKEYDMLREMIMSRIRSRLAIGGFLIALIGYLTSVADVPATWRILWTSTAAIVIAAVWYRFGQLIKRATLRVVEIEAGINEVAGQELLVWESRLVNRSFFHRHTTPAKH